MKKACLILIFFALSIAVNAQGKYAYMYSQKVFDAMPAYKKALTDVEAYAKKGKEDAEKELKVAQTLFNQYNQFASSMPAKQAEELKKMVIDQEKRANDYEERFFGKDGELERKQQELMKPIEASLISAVDKISKQAGYDMVFDLSLVKVTIYQLPSLDITPLVMKELGL